MARSAEKRSYGERKGIFCLEVVFSRTVLAGGGDLGGRKGDGEFSALRWCFAALCWRDGAI